jgi:sec-independent protein translocase protein TatA
MGFSGINLWQLLLVLAIVVILFGTKKLRGVGSDLGGAIRGFKKAMKDEDAEKSEQPPSQLADNQQTKTTEQQKSKSEDKV